MLWQTPHYKATPEGLSSAVSGPISVSLDATPNLHFDRRLGRFSFSVSLDATPNLHFDRLISTTFTEVVEKGRASILQARLISTTSSESGHAVMYGPESHKHENVDSGPRRLIG